MELTNEGGTLFAESFPAPSCSLTHELTRVGAMQNLVKLIGQGNVACEKEEEEKKKRADNKTTWTTGSRRSQTPSSSSPAAPPEIKNKKIRHSYRFKCETEWQEKNAP